MKRANKFTISPLWKLLLNDMGIDMALALNYAMLPVDLCDHQSTVSAEEYFRLWQGIEKASGKLEMPLLLAEHLSVEAFDPPIFASICSDDLNSALNRLSHYKPLIGPMILDVKVTAETTRAIISCYGHQGELPSALTLAELTFFTQLARIATRHHIVPKRIELPQLPSDIAAYEQYFGCKLTQNSQVAISFSSQDATRPFLTANSAMWSFFEAKLNQNLAELSASATTGERVKAVLFEALPSGKHDIISVADKLAMSKRSLQRKLTAENLSFKTILQQVRAELADHYLLKSQLSLAEISFLLGFVESNSFIRAYHNWKGQSPGSFREAHYH